MDYTASLSDANLDLDMPQPFIHDASAESDLDVCSSLSDTILCEQKSAKRDCEAMEEDQELLRSTAEVKRLKKMNCLLHSSMQCVSQRIETARAEQTCLRKMIQALHLYKGHFQVKTDGQWLDKNLLWLSDKEDPTEEYMVFERPCNLTGSGSVLQKHENCGPQQTAESLENDDASQRAKLPARLEHSTELASLAAVAAAALAVNKGQPAGALLDLLLLADKRLQNSSQSV